MTIARLIARTQSASSCCAFAFALTISFVLSGCGGNGSPADPAYVTSARPQLNQLLSDMQAPDGRPPADTIARMVIGELGKP